MKKIALLLVANLKNLQQLAVSHVLKNKKKELKE